MIQIIVECSDADEWRNAEAIRIALEVEYPQCKVVVDAPL